MERDQIEKILTIFFNETEKESNKSLPTRTPRTANQIPNSKALKIQQHSKYGQLTTRTWSVLADSVQRMNISSTLRPTSRACRSQVRCRQDRISSYSFGIWWWKKKEGNLVNKKRNICVGWM